MARPREERARVWAKRQGLVPCALPHLHLLAKRLVWHRAHPPTRQNLQVWYLSALNRRQDEGIWYPAMPRSPIWYPPSGKTASLVPQIAGCEFPDLGFLRAAGTKSPKLAENREPNPRFLPKTARNSFAGNQTTCFCHASFSWCADRCISLRARGCVRLRALRPAVSEKVKMKSSKKLK